MCYEGAHVAISIPRVCLEAGDDVKINIVGKQILLESDPGFYTYHLFDQ